MDSLLFNPKIMNGDCIFLNYHAIVDPLSKAVNNDKIYSIDAPTFRTHLELFKRLNLNIITLDQLGLSKQKEGLTICLTFDDGHESDHTIVAPLLNEFNYKASFFPTLSNFLSNNNRWQEYRILAENGHVIGAHGVTHKYLSNLKAKDQFYELNFSKTFIEEKIGQSPRYFALPGGKYNRKTLQLAQQCGYKALLTTKFGLIYQNDCPFMIKRWSLKRKTSLNVLESVLKKEASTHKRIRFGKSIKRSVSRLIGNKLSDKINYRIP
ncbi:MAG: peptidoglycan/xylan/chitin deacetylase (PgdA/CDA1 family) [Crocinitomix sp.]|jgi:peptidoglycan/xylan/chitin deacetylase (PgdA/CDA1 family)